MRWGAISHRVRPLAAPMINSAHCAAPTLAASRGFRTGMAQCAEFIIGPAKGRTRWLIAPYSPLPYIDVYETRRDHTEAEGARGRLASAGGHPCGVVWFHRTR